MPMVLERIAKVLERRGLAHLALRADGSAR
jgi:hypothetical protein